MQIESVLVAFIEFQTSAPMLRGLLDGGKCTTMYIVAGTALVTWSMQGSETHAQIVIATCIAEQQIATFQ